MNLEDLKAALRAFAAERDWDQFHSPKNLSMALSVEVAELVEHFQWLTEDESCALPSDAAEQVTQEIADIQIYLVRLADKLGVDIEVEAPQHTFVGHFIGSPGMNVLPCELADGQPTIAGQPVATANAGALEDAGGVLEIGVRPEFVSFAPDGLAVEVVKVSDAGRYRVVDTRCADHSIKLLVDEASPVPEGAAHLRFDPERTRVYRNGWVVT
jgi:NTP pyrophosphatase (non-canonical NTP hydrolase)